MKVWSAVAARLQRSSSSPKQFSFYSYSSVVTCFHLHVFTQFAPSRCRLLVLISPPVLTLVSEGGGSRCAILTQTCTQLSWESLLQIGAFWICCSEFSSTRHLFTQLYNVYASLRYAFRHLLMLSNFNFHTGAEPHREPTEMMVPFQVVVTRGMKSLLLHKGQTERLALGSTNQPIRGATCQLNVA